MWKNLEKNTVIKIKMQLKKKKTQFDIITISFFLKTGQKS